MHKAYKFRLFPTKSQRTTMEQTLDLCRWTYNQTLAYRKNAWDNEQRSVSKYETHNLVPNWKVEKPELNDLFSQVLQNVQERVDLALKAFFRRVKSGKEPGYPRFRGKGWYDSFTYPQFGFKVDAGKLHLSKIGDIKIKLHRQIEGKIKRLTIRRSATGNGLLASQSRWEMFHSHLGKMDLWLESMLAWKALQLCLTVRRSRTQGFSEPKSRGL